LLRHRFPSVAFMADNPTPVAVIAALQDRVVKPRRTAALIARLQNLVFHAALPGADHNTLYYAQDYASTLRAAFEALQNAAASSDRAAQ
jgi:hypothetical protein